MCNKCKFGPGIHMYFSCFCLQTLCNELNVWFNSSNPHLFLHWNLFAMNSFRRTSFIFASKSSQMDQNMFKKWVSIELRPAVGNSCTEFLRKKEKHHTILWLLLFQLQFKGSHWKKVSSIVLSNQYFKCFHFL